MPQVDTIRLRRWMNVRKITAADLASAAGLDVAALEAILRREVSDVDTEVCGKLADELAVDIAAITPAGQREQCVILMRAARMRATRRAIRRDGIHFYNYYSMAAPKGRVAPVILDILCPDGRLPALNNGHLEPAITVNIGPGPINGRWRADLSPDTWQVLQSNSGDDSWIVGDSYIEPSYCPHSYSLASERQARIISYTCSPAIGALVEESNQWSSPAFDVLLDRVGDAGPASWLRLLLDRRAYSVAQAAAASRVDPDVLEAAAAGRGRLSLDDARSIGQALGFDYRVILPAPHKRDAVGKTYCSIGQSRQTMREFKRYVVASMASAPHLPDMVGLFMRVPRGPGGPGLDLTGHGETHYLVGTDGLALSWREADGSVRTERLFADDSIWVGPFVEHGFGGEGSLARMASGNHLGHLDQLALSGTFEARSTLARGRRDQETWGYDVTADGSG